MAKGKIQWFAVGFCGIESIYSDHSLGWSHDAYGTKECGALEVVVSCDISMVMVVNDLLFPCLWNFRVRKIESTYMCFISNSTSSSTNGTVSKF